MALERLPACVDCYRNHYGETAPAANAEPDTCSACGADDVACVKLVCSVDEEREVQWPLAEGVRGVNRRTYPSEYLPDTGRNEKTTVSTVLVASHPMVGDYTCYNGIGSPEFVRRHGDKIPFEEAQGHFTGQLERERYRN